MTMTQYKSTYDNSYALVIGIDDYQHFQPLYNAVPDATAVAETFESLDFKVKTLFNEEASRRSIYQHIDNWLSTTGDDDRVIIYYAGHGSTRTTRHDEKIGYLLPYGVSRGDFSAAISTTSLIEHCDNFVPAKHILFILDACFSGLAFTRADRNEPVQDRLITTYRSRQAIQAIVAGQADEEVADSGPSGHSIFTGHLLQRLRSTESLLTAKRLGILLEEDVARASQSRQTPHSGAVIPGKTGDFVFWENREAFYVSESKAGTRIPMPNNHAGIRLSNLLPIVGLLAEDSIQCPHCLVKIKYKRSVKECPECRNKLSPLYVNSYDEALPFFVQIMGYSNVGKTVYLLTSTHLLSRLNRLWDEYSFLSINREAHMLEQNGKDFLIDGSLPNTTSLAFESARIFALNDMPRWGSRIFVNTDIAGEHFHNYQIHRDFIRYVINASTSLLMFSIGDAQHSKSRISDLLSNYIRTIENEDRDFRHARRNIVIVLSKGDLILDLLPVSIREYLLDDPLSAILGRQENNTHENQNLNPYTQIDKYMDKLREVSDELSEWISMLPVGENLLSVASAYNIDLKFCIISSAGMVENNNYKIRPLRILDPLFWALEMNSKPREHS